MFDVNNGQTVRLASVTDGTSNTIAAGEVLPAQRADNNVWEWNSGGYGTTVPINYPCTVELYVSAGWGSSNWASRCAYTNTGFKSKHPGGANFVFVDGSVHFLKQTIAMTTYCALGSRAGGEVISADCVLTEASRLTIRQDGSRQSRELRGARSRCSADAPCAATSLHTFLIVNASQDAHAHVLSQCIRSPFLRASSRCPGPSLMTSCGTDDGLGKRYPVSGTVTYNGKPLEKGKISFVPEDPKNVGASGAIENGSYTLSTGGQDDGARAGKYKVTITAKEDAVRQGQGGFRQGSSKGARPWLRPGAIPGQGGGRGQEPDPDRLRRCDHHDPHGRGQGTIQHARLQALRRRSARSQSRRRKAEAASDRGAENPVHQNHARTPLTTLPATSVRR